MANHGLSDSQPSLCIRITRGGSRKLGVPYPTPAKYIKISQREAWQGVILKTSLITGNSGTDSREMKTYNHTKTFTYMFMAASLIIVLNWKEPNIYLPMTG